LEPTLFFLERQQSKQQITLIKLEVEVHENMCQKEILCNIFNEYGDLKRIREISIIKIFIPNLLKNKS